MEYLGNEEDVPYLEIRELINTLDKLEKDKKIKKVKGMFYKELPVCS